MFGFFTSKSKSSLPAKVIQDIDGALEAILKLCTENIVLLSDEERSSFIDEYTRLSGDRLAALRPTKSKKSTLSEILRECEALKLTVETTCYKRHADKIEQDRRISRPTSNICQDSAVEIAPAERQTAATIQIEGWRQSVNSSLDTTSPPESPIPERLSSVATNSDTTATQVRRQIESSLNGLAPLSQSAATNSESWYTAPDVSAPSNTTTTIPNISTVDRPSPSSFTDTDCMIIEPNSHVESATFNIDSEGGTGATLAHPTGSRSRVLPAQQQPAARVHQPQVPHPVKRERVMYFGSGTTSYNATLNIRSPNASGAMEQVIP